MVLNWINYLCFVTGYVNMISFLTITTIVLKKNPKEKLNWIFATSFFFLATAYAILPTGAIVYTETNPTPMLILTKMYAFFLFIAITILSLSAIAINYSTYFAFKWYIILPTIILIAGIGTIIFATNSITAIPGPTADTKTEPSFLYIYYPLYLILTILIYTFFIRTYKQTNDRTLRISLKHFLGGFSICIFSIIPNILSNILADIFENAQIFNGIEFFLVLFGTTVLLGGFLVRNRKKDISLEEAVEGIKQMNYS